MAPSRALRKVCSEQSQRYTSITPQASNKRPSCRRTITTPESSCRAFSISISHKADESPPAPTTPKPQSGQGASFGFQRPRNPRSIDLSSITSNPNYKAPTTQPAPKRNQAVNAETLKHLDSLIGKARANTSASKPSKPMAYNADTYASKGRTATTFQRPSINDEIMSMVGRSKRDSAARTGFPVTGLTSDLERATLPALKLGPSLGRTVTLVSGSDLTRAFQALEGKINGRGNAVRRDERAQLFHVRAGQKKKIQRRQRWRVLFKQGYVAEMKRVRKMISQGW